MKAAKLTVSVVVLLLTALLSPGSAMAEAQAPQWTIDAVSRPTNFAPGSSEGSYKLLITNTGGESTDGSPVVITDELPAGLSLDSEGGSGESLLSHRKVSCVRTTCTYEGAVVPGETLTLSIPVDVAPGASSELTTVVRVSGGGAQAASASVPTTISEEPAEFGVSPGGATTALSSDQAGAHADLTTSIAFDTVSASGLLAGDPKDTVDILPPGFAGDLVDNATCEAALFARDECPIVSQVGVVTLDLLLEGGIHLVKTEPVYNLSPNPGDVAKIGFPTGAGPHIQGDVKVRPGDYRLQTTFENTNEIVVELDNVSLTIWGVPADPIHDPLRWNPHGGSSHSGEFGTSSDAHPAPFFTNPTSCGPSPLVATFTTDSWQEPESSTGADMPFGPIVGCDRLTLESKMETIPTSTSAETSTGLNVNLQIPQTYDNAYGLATSHLDGVEVTLPEGMSLNPSAGSGLGSCTRAQFEYEGATAQPLFGLGCPNESKVGSIHIHSPSLAEEATGSLFVAKPFENPFGSLLALYLVARIPNRGVVVTAAGEVHADPVTGRLTTTFSENPQLPFSNLMLAFRQGATSPLITPPACGEFATGGVLTPWSVPGQELPVSSSFAITSGVDGGPCPSGGLPPFRPGLIAGSVNNAAGQYSPFYVRISRDDGEQEITHFSIKLPPGVVGKLAGIPLCSDQQIVLAKSREHEGGGGEEEASPSCPAASGVGRTLVEAGVGSVLAQAPGKVYLAGPYHGAPISVVAVTAAKVGPFDLGTVVVREALKVNPETAEVFVDATGSDPLPHIIDGIPTHLRDIRIYMDRPEFVLNPTSCAPTSTTSTVLGSGLDFTSEADDNPFVATSRFQAGDCAALGFKPKLQLFLKGGARRSQVPAFRAVLHARPGDANISHAEVVLPPSEILEQGHIRTICTRVQFNEGGGNGEHCPAASIYGRARAVTPILAEALEGPVYLRANGGERKLPDLVAALHGSEINIDLVGYIDSVYKKSKHGEVIPRIRNRFEVVPDAPVTSFTLEMFGGKKGLLVNSTDMCKGKHLAEANFTGHNGKLDDFRPPLKPLGCKKGGKGKAGSRGHHAHKRRS